MTATTTARLDTPAAPPAAVEAPDLEAIKKRQQATWASGDYAVIGTTLQIVGETLAEFADVRAGEKVLDVAAGNGNATLAAARRFAAVTSTDYVPELLERGRARAAAEGLQAAFQTADVENLPYADSTFDVVLSTFGVMFTPDHERAAREMLRVVSSGGRIGLANWTPSGFLGELFRPIGRYAPPPAGFRSPMLWGNEPHIVALFGTQAADIRIARRIFNFRYRSAQHWVDVFREFYGPTYKAFLSLEQARQRALEQDLCALLERHNVAGSGSLVVPGEYLDVVIVKE